MSTETSAKPAPAFESEPFLDIPFGLAKPEEVLPLTGIEQLSALMKGALPAPTMAQTLRQWISAIEPGRAEFRGDPSDAYLNPMGLVHGGWTMALLDSALGCAVQTRLDAGQTFISLGTEVKFIRPITPRTGQVRSVASVVTRGRRTATASAYVEDQSGRILATGTTTCFIETIVGA